jgi:hypothetical protein
MRNSHVAAAFEQDRFKNIRTDNQVRKSFYPDQLDRKSRQLLKKLNKN